MIGGILLVLSVSIMRCFGGKRLTKLFYFDLMSENGRSRRYVFADTSIIADEVLAQKDLESNLRWLEGVKIMEGVYEEGGWRWPLSGIAEAAATSVIQQIVF